MAGLPFAHESERPAAQRRRAETIALGRYRLPRRVVWQGRLAPAFWTVGAAASLLLNAILIAALILLGRELFALKSLVNRQLVGGLYYNFLLMDQARIKTDVPVETTIPVRFDLRVKADTTVTLTERARIDNAQVSVLSAPTDILLPAGTTLPVSLDLVVPVDTTVPVSMTVPVDIPLQETELHEPFVGMQNVVAPYFDLLYRQPNSWEEWLCRSLPGFFCP